MHGNIFPNSYNSNSTATNFSSVNVRLNRILESAMRKVIGTSSLTDMLSNKRTEIMKRIKELVSDESKHFGLKVVDVRILRADLPKENSDAIYSRMQSSREKEVEVYSNSTVLAQVSQEHTEGVVHHTASNLRLFGNYHSGPQEYRIIIILINIIVIIEIKSTHK